MVVLWGLVLLGLAVAVVFAITRPETSLPYVYDEERDRLPALTGEVTGPPEREEAIARPGDLAMTKEQERYKANGEKEISPDTVVPLSEVQDTKTKGQASESVGRFPPTPPGEAIESSPGIEGATAARRLQAARASAPSDGAIKALPEETDLGGADLEEDIKDDTDIDAVKTADNLSASKPKESLLDLAPAYRKYATKRELDPSRPQIAIVFSGLGLSHEVTYAAIRQLPAEVTLSFSPYTRQLEGLVALARSYEHEVLIDLPLEPTDFPRDDPGPHTLLVKARNKDNLEKLDWVSGRASQAIGFTAFMGERFVTSIGPMERLFEYLRVRGFFFLDNGNNDRSLTPEVAKLLEVPYAVTDFVVDDSQLSRAAIDARLAQTERHALEEGRAIALARPYPVSLKRIAQWTGELPSRGFQLIPLSALNALQSPNNSP